MARYCYHASRALIKFGTDFSIAPRYFEWIFTGNYVRNPYSMMQMSKWARAKDNHYNDITARKAFQIILKFTDDHLSMPGIESRHFLFLIDQFCTWFISMWSSKFYAVIHTCEWIPQKKHVAERLRLQKEGENPSIRHLTFTYRKYLRWAPNCNTITVTE